MRILMTPGYMTKLTLTALILITGFPGIVFSFHDKGVANCSGCHVMHSQEEGIAYQQHGRPHLLIEDSPSAVCLLCHSQQNGSVLGVDPLAPPPERGAGNFVFLYEDNLNDGPSGSDNPIGGYAAGHSIVVPSHGLAQDPIHLVAPGGSYPSSDLSCISCHDPHGNENYRMLYGVGPISAPGQGPVYNFTHPAPQAIGLPLGTGSSESADNHIAYISGMSDWCANCHGQYHDLVGTQNFEHDFDHLFEESQVSRYNSYNGIEDTLGADPTMSYIPEVPFEDLFAANNSTAGPSAASRISCITCHRAHASSSPAAGRWDFNVQYLDNDGFESGSYPIPPPYNGYQEPPLCQKCHSGAPAIPLNQE